MIHLKNAVKFLLIIILLTNFGELSACTSFILKNGHQVVVGRNYDYKSSLGVIMINSRNVIKTAIPFPGENSVEWISKYGSITFNALGREQPNEGMNEVGLVVTGLSVDDAPKYPEVYDNSFLTGSLLAIGVMGIVFGVLLINMQHKLGRMARIAGIMEIVASSLFFTLVLAPLGGLSLMVAELLEIILIFKVIEMVQAKGSKVNAGLI